MKKYSPVDWRRPRPPRIDCRFVLTRGPRKGQQCGRRSDVLALLEGTALCGAHVRFTAKESHKLSEAATTLVANWIEELRIYEAAGHVNTQPVSAAPIPATPNLPTAPASHTPPVTQRPNAAEFVKAAGGTDASFNVVRLHGGKAHIEPADEATVPQEQAQQQSLMRLGTTGPDGGHEVIVEDSGQLTKLDDPTPAPDGSNLPTPAETVRIVEKAMVADAYLRLVSERDVRRIAARSRKRQKALRQAAFVARRFNELRGKRRKALCKLRRQFHERGAAFVAQAQRQGWSRQLFDALQSVQPWRPNMPVRRTSA